MKYPVARPSLGEEELNNVMEVVTKGQLSAGPMVKEFERELADYLDCREVVVCSNGTVALHLALAGIGIGPGDEVIVPDLTYVATANAVAYTGAKPVLVDIERTTWGMDPDDVARKITEKTRAILPVHLYGQAANMNRLMEIAGAYGLRMIEDAAEGLGGSWGGQALGTIGIAGTFSFYGNKVITTGEGGAVVTNNVCFAETLRCLRGQGQHPEQRYFHNRLGFNYRMTDLQAAIGLAQLNRIDEMLKIRRAIFAVYHEVLHDFERVDGNAPWLFTFLLPKTVERPRVMAELLVREIETRPAFIPLHALPMYCDNPKKFPVAYDIGTRGLSLPTYEALTEEDVKFIAQAVLCACEH